jgi:uncharacterized integral membrane protein (TIGR00698 family)
MKIEFPIFSKIVFFLLVVLCLSGFVDPPIALLLGLVFSQLVQHPFLSYNAPVTKFLLQFSVVGLGFGMNLFEAFKAGKQGFLFTLISIISTLALGWLIGKLLSVPLKTRLLISSGTAICGGSAIAAVAPVIDAQEGEISVSLGTIFILNAVALFLFPGIGHFLNLSQHQFGIWAAIAIHDTSSVVGASQKFGEEALKIATVVKMERALWIIPLTLLFSFVFKKDKSKVTIPYFIFFFVLAMLMNTYLPSFHEVGAYLALLAKRGLILTLFLIGAGMTRTAIQNVGYKPLLLGVVIWLFISVFSLVVILQTV